MRRDCVSFLTKWGHFSLVVHHYTSRIMEQSPFHFPHIIKTSTHNNLWWLFGKEIFNLKMNIFVVRRYKTNYSLGVTTKLKQHSHSVLIQCSCNCSKRGEKIKISLGRSKVLHNSCDKGDPMNSMKNLGTGGWVLWTDISLPLHGLHQHLQKLQWIFPLEYKWIIKDADVGFHWDTLYSHYNTPRFWSI